MAVKILTISTNGIYRDDRQGSGRDSNIGIGIKIVMFIRKCQ